MNVKSLPCVCCQRRAWAPHCAHKRCGWCRCPCGAIYNFDEHTVLPKNGPKVPAE